jgi:hypothetical protein
MNRKFKIINPFCATKNIVKTKSDINENSLHAVFYDMYIWDTGSVLNVSFFEKDSPEWKRKWVEKTIKEQLEPFVNITFNFIDITDDTIGDIRVGFKQHCGNPYGCYSVIGKQAKFNTNCPSMTLSWLDSPSGLIDGLQGSFKYNNIIYYTPPNSSYNDLINGDVRNGNDIGATIIHEFCHALGMEHEHQNPKLGIVEWYWDKVYKEYGPGTQNNWSAEDIQNNITGNCKLDTTTNICTTDWTGHPDWTSSKFDLQSIMLYPIQPGFCKTYPDGFNQNPMLSETDKLWLNEKYPGSNKAKPKINYINKMKFKFQLIANYFQLHSTNRKLFPTTSY